MKEADPQSLWRTYFPECGHAHPPETRREIRIEGRVDLDSASRVRSTLLDALTGRPPLLDVALRDVSFMDTAGLAVLVEVARQARQARICIRLADPSPAVLGMLELAHLKDFFPRDEKGPAGNTPA